MKNTLAVLNELEGTGHIDQYAFGGAVAALFYMEPFHTEYLDILILLDPGDVANLAPLSRIYERVRGAGYREEGPFMLIEAVPVQLLVAYRPLVVRSSE